MTEHTGLPVSGYKPQSDARVALVNEAKQLEEMVMRFCDRLRSMPPGEIDPYWCATGRTDIEKGFMAINRSVFQPGRVSLPGDQT